MKYALPSLRAVLAALSLGAAVHAATPPESPELTEARAKLLELYQRYKSDEQEAVKAQRARVSALEYIAAAGAESAAQPTSKSVDVQFAGGTVTALMAAIEKAGGGINIIGEANDLAIELPPFSLRNADGASLATALDGLLRARGYVLQGSGRPEIGKASVYVLRKQSLYERSSINSGNESRFYSFQLNPYLEFQSVDDIVGAITTAWELDPARARAALNVKFHPPTGILLVSGPSQAIDMVNNILSQLRKSPPTLPAVFPGADPTPAPRPSSKKN